MDWRTHYYRDGSTPYDFRISVITTQVSMAVSPLTHRNGEADHKIHHRTKDPEEPKQSWKKGTKLEDSHFPLSTSTTKLPGSKQCGTGESRNKPTHLQSTGFQQR